MKARIEYIFRYLFFWVAFFLIAKVLFLIYHFKTYSEFGLINSLKVLFYGLRLDLSITAYFSILPFLLIAVSSFFKNFNLFKRIIKIYTLVLATIVAFLHIIDLELFSIWGYRLDATPLKYINTPGEMLASAGASPVTLLLGLLALLIIFSFFLFYFLFKNIETTRRSIGTVFLVLPLTASLIILIRGGLQLAPINQSAVYFSTNSFLNQAAVNVPWNLTHSLLEKTYSTKNPFVFLSKEDSEDIVNSLYSKETIPSVRILKEGKKNIILIIWESFTAKALNDVEGKQITPRFKELIKEGVYFDNIYASGDRSEKGIIALLSGYPAQPTTSIITFPGKTTKLSTLPLQFKKDKYFTSFYYGGEMEFANIKSYLCHCGFDKLTGIEAFDKKDQNSKWGAHDEVVLKRMLEDTKSFKEPFFNTLFTLSSHEPFEIPAEPLLSPDSRERMFLNSLHYTDASIGAFIDEAKKQPWWDNTVIIITADHGHVMPGNGIATHQPQEFKIPMLWLGGALTKKDTVITQLGSQTDLASTLLTQFDKTSDGFRFSRDLFVPSKNPFAYYAFNNGFGLMNDSCKVVYDNVSNQPVFKEGTDDTQFIKKGRAYLQVSFQDYLNK
ncbi:sulfatase [Sporocytophaga myxococcoides]|uniref:Sulfatase n=1 Tax=Sporocytophaga myxococcoides TaxID=153721 RepID=A0A098LA81_9BACT|nr:alkaline phosphatase family protein [Sporocytophaga myxococcoides]GAL83314.1 sulfatase [Sporocytophaga myxococcoides]